METAPGPAVKSPDEINRIYQRHNISWPEVFASDVKALKEKEPRFSETRQELAGAQEKTAAYLAEVKDALAQNETMKQAVYSYFDSPEDLADFKVQIWQSEARYIDQVGALLDSNASAELPPGGIPNPAVMAEAKEALVSRAMNILEILRKTVADKNEAMKELEVVSKEYLIKPLNEAPLMQNLNYQTLEKKTLANVLETAKTIEREIAA